MVHRTPPSRRHVSLGRSAVSRAKPNRPGPRFQRAFVCPRNGSFLTRRRREMDSNPPSRHERAGFCCGRRIAGPSAGSQKGFFFLRYRWFESISLQQTVSLSPVAAFEGREPGFPRGFGQLAWRPGQQRLGGGFDIASTGGNISVGPYSSTAVRLVVAPGLTRGRSLDL